jgi:hypothetical protein
MQKLLYIPIVLLLFSCGKVPSNEAKTEVIHFVGDFETANLNGFHLLVPDTLVNAQLVTHPVRKGLYALKNTLNPGDYINNGYRSELAIYNCANYHTEVFYGFSFMVDTNYQDTEYNLVCQWQDLPNYLQGEDWNPSPVLHGSPPPVALVYIDGKLELKMNDNPNVASETFLVGTEQAIQKGVWNDVVAQIYWSDDETGYVQVWLNGNLITPINGTDGKFYHRNLFNRTGNYFKFGQYRGKENTAHSNTIYFDEVKVGTSYFEVAP